MQLYSCAYDYCDNVSGDPNNKSNDIPKLTKKTTKSSNGKQGKMCTFLHCTLYINT